MRISSVIDLQQFENNGVFDDDSVRQVKSYADSYFQTMSEVKSAINAGSCGMKGRINEKLQEHTEQAYDAICTLACSEEYAELQVYDDELQAFQIAVQAYLKEKPCAIIGQDLTTFDVIDYTEHFLGIVRKMRFYFRRIQLALAKPLQMECMTYIRQRHISVYAVAQMLLYSQIGNMDLVVERLAGLYLEQGMNQDAIYLLSYIKDYVDEDKRADIQACIEQI